MFPIIPAVVAFFIIKKIYDVVSDKKYEPHENIALAPPSVLALNFGRLRSELSGNSVKKIAIIGQPGAGKSTLLKTMTFEEVIPLPDIGGHTDATDWSSKLDCNLINRYKDLVFVDVPGYDTALHPVSDFMDNFPFGHFDAFVFVVRGKLYHADEKIFSRIRSSGKSVVVTRSFKDGMSKEDVLASQKDISSRLALDAPIIFFSNRTKENVDAVLKSVVG